jgi:hypothetical protein
MLDPMTKYRVSGPFPVTGVQPVTESDKPSKAEKAGDK